MGDGNHHQRERRRGGANHRHTGRWMEFMLFSFHSEKGNGGAIRKRQRKEAPPKGGGGRQHRQKEAATGEGTTIRSRRGRSSLLFF